MISRRRKARHHEPEELNITTFMNLMVILVPFLLISAAFSRLAVVELNLPGASDGSVVEPPGLHLEVIVRANVIEVGDRDEGILMRLPSAAGKPDLRGLATYLKRVKATYPDKVDATLLLESAVEYEVLVQVIDAVRSYDGMQAGEIVRAELFPEISIGDAPVGGAGS